MIVYELVCAHEHRFEGWFASVEDYARQRETAMIHCPVCDDGTIERRPSANVQIGRSPAPAAERTDTAVVSGDAETLRQLRRLIERTDNVGPAFAEEARKIHYDEVPKRAIRGQATREDADALREEGIDFIALPGFLTRDLQ